MKRQLLSLFIFAALLTACGSEEASKVKETETVEDNAVEEVSTNSNNNSENEEKKGDDVEKEAETTPDSNNSLYAEGYKADVPAVTENQAELTQESYDFIVKNYGLLPAKDDKSVEAVKTLTEDVDIKLLNKNLAPYYSTFVSYEGYVIQIEEQTYENGEIISWINIYDEAAGTNHNVIMYKSSGDILEEDYVQFWGIPLAKYSYATVDGGFQNTILFGASHVEKK